MISVIQNQNDIEVVLSDVKEVNLADIFDCGQAFRFEELPDGTWQGVAFNRILKVAAANDKIILFNTDVSEFETVWRSFFDFDRDYLYIRNILSADKSLKAACRHAESIRVLRQDAWETLCSFIISQNNNIPRIKGIINRLCRNFGEEIGDGFYTFPPAKKIALLSEEDLAPLRSGFRAKYILDAARKVASKEIDLEKTAKMETDKARAELMKIYGVGEKVADCVLLFGMGHVDALPRDVWIKRVLSELFDGALPDFAIPYAGIAQQYLFHWARMNKMNFGEQK